LDQFTHFNFEGYKYYVIPDIVTYPDDNNILDEPIHNFKFEAEERMKAQNTEKRNVLLRYDNYRMQYENDLWYENTAGGQININLLFLFESHGIETQSVPSRLYAENSRLVSD
jgi:hypothetical protein